MNGPAPSSGQARRVLVTGDVVVDHRFYLGQRSRPGSTIRLGTVAVESGGGAALLRDLVREVSVAARARREATSGYPLADSVGLGDVVSFGLKEIDDCDLPTSLHGYGVFKPCRQQADDDDSPEVWRLTEPLGFGPEPAQQFVPLADREALEAEHDVLVIDDAGLGFRVQTARDAWPPCLQGAAKAWPGWLLLKLSAPVGCGDLWRAIRGDGPVGKNLVDRTVAIVSINDLRAEGAQVSHALSWERSALDLTSELRRNPRIKELSACRYLIVAFHTDGALLADFGDPDAPAFRLIFDAAHLEADWAENVRHTIYGLQTCLAAAIVSRLPGPGAAAEEVRGRLERGVAAGLAGMRRLLHCGHGRVGDPSPGFPFAAVAGEIVRPTHLYSTATVPGADEPRRLRWSILEGDSTKDPGPPLFGTARRVAIRGASELSHVPYQRYGDLFVIERSEIESLRSLKGLIRRYEGDPAARQPLSIAVFGPPGAGKSFGVKQIAKAVLGEKTPILEFNLAQLTDPGELVGLLHQVRDKVLEGRLPVVFWDEFDSDGLKWLQFLLAPMQDGKFQEGQLTHPIGRCVFVFAGGTSYDFQSFGPKPPPHESPEETRSWERFKSRKGFDFVSRLGGYLNVLGPNRRQVRDLKTGTWHDDRSDVSFPIRRALFIRSKLARKPDQRLPVDRAVLTALLEVGRYRHGSRSLEKLLEQMQRTSRTGVIGRSDLPPTHLLALHAEPDEFLRLVDRDTEFAGDVEELAAAYHWFYSKAFPEGKYHMPYGELPEAIKEDNRAAARRIADVLALAGLYLTGQDSGAPDPLPGEIETILRRNLEILAEAEHEGWMDHKLRQGWRKVVDPAQRNDEVRLHHLLIPYQKQSEHDRQKDRNAVLNYQEIVSEQGYRIVSEPPGTRPGGVAEG